MKIIPNATKRDVNKCYKVIRDNFKEDFKKTKPSDLVDSACNKLKMS